MNKGILTHARDALVKGWGAEKNVAMGVVPMGQMNFRGEPLKRGNLRKALQANKGTVYACTDLLGIGVASTPQRVYVTKTGKEKSNTKYYDTRQVSKHRLDEIFAKAAPGGRVSRAADLEEVLNGPLVELLADINGYMSAADSKLLTVVNLGLTGNAYWVLQRNKIPNGNGKGMPAAIWIAPSADMSVKADKNVWISGYTYKKGTNDEKIYDADDVVHFKKVSPLSQFYGEAPLFAVADAYDLEQYMIAFEKESFQTGGNLRSVIWTKGPITKEAANKVKTRFNTIKDQVIVLNQEDFALEFTQLNNPTARDMGFKDGLVWARDQIAMAYHVPKSMLTTDDVNRANSREGSYHFQKYGILPYVVTMDERISEHLAPQFNDRFVVISDNPVLPDEEQEREERKVNLEMGVTSRNEERALIGLDPIDGGDEILVPSTHVPLTQLLQGEVESEEQMAERVRRVMDRVKELQQGG